MSNDPPSEDRFDAEFANALGHAIKVLRTGLGMGRRELADAAHLSYSYLTEIENGKKQASASAQQVIARVLGLSVSELLASAEEWAEAPRASSDESSAERLRRLTSTRGARDRQSHWFGVTHADLAVAEPTSSMAAALGPERDETLVELRRLLDQLSPSDRERVLDLARRLAAVPPPRR